MAAASTAERRSGGAWRLWALIPLLLLVGVVALFASSGTTLLDLVGRAPPALDQFDIRRVEFKPGEITIRVTNPQQKKLTIASVTATRTAPATVRGGPPASGNGSVPS